MCNQQSLRSACAYTQSVVLEYSMSVKLLTEHRLEFLSLKAGCTGSSESTLVKMPHYWKSHVVAHLCIGSMSPSSCVLKEYVKDNYASVDTLSLLERNAHYY